jgi:hypothetical protein
MLSPYRLGECINDGCHCFAAATLLQAVGAQAQDEAAWNDLQRPLLVASGFTAR